MSGTLATSPALPHDVDGLLAAARHNTGLEDFGDPQFVQGLRILCDSLKREAALNALGEQMVYGGIIRLLTNRLRLHRDLRLHPEILEERIEKPIVILGLPRTGTSKLQRVMSADPLAQRLDMWRQINPAPFPGEDPGNPTARIEAALQVENLLTTMFPDFQARHPLEACEPDEEIHLMEGSFDNMLSWVFSRVPSFYLHFTTCDTRPMYGYLHTLLQYLQWQDGGGRGRPWILKSPTHIGDMPTLMATFPDAIIVHCHRNPRQVIPSFAALISAGRRIGSDHVDPVEVGQDMLRYWADQLDRYLVVRQQLPKDTVLDLRFDEIRKDVVGAVARIYAKAGRPLTPEAFTAFRTHEKSRPEHHFGSYDYNAETHGLSLDAIDDRFAQYRQTFAEYL